MDLYEIEGKALLRSFGIPTDRGMLYDRQADLQSYPYPCVVKGQILSGKRGKAGAVRFADTPEELREAAEAIMNIHINGKAMEGIMVSEKLSICGEFYLGLTLDTRSRSLLMLFSPSGGMDIEEVASSMPEKLLRIDCSNGFDRELFVSRAECFSLDEKLLDQLSDIAAKLTEACFALDATTIEINPLALLSDGTLMAIDSKLVIDDNALYRQKPELILPRRKSEKTLAQKEAEDAGLIYVELDKSGSIGLIAGGAGIGMATVDTISHYGGKAYNFLDLGGGVTAEKMYHAMHLLLNNPDIKSILVNVFGGINNCAVMAEGIKQAYTDYGKFKRVVIKSRGFNQEEGWSIYEKLGFRQVKYGTTDEAVQLLLEEGVEQ